MENKLYSNEFVNDKLIEFSNKILKACDEYNYN
jgi:hypothetical protein